MHLRNGTDADNGIYMHQAGAESGEIEMTKEQLVKLLRTGRTDVDKQEPTRVIAHRIEDMNEKDLREAVIEFVYSR